MKIVHMGKELERLVNYMNKNYVYVKWMMISLNVGCMIVYSEN